MELQGVAGVSKTAYLSRFSISPCPVLHRIAFPVVSEWRQLVRLAWSYLVVAMDTPAPLRFGACCNNTSTRIRFLKFSPLPKDKV
jgi:hypothetical protein